YQAMPAVAFTLSEIASVGYTNDEAKEAGLEDTTTKFSLGGNGRAISLDCTSEFVRLITTKEYYMIVGTHVTGVNSSDLIAELSLAVHSGMDAQDISLTIHAHPTLAESVMDTAEAALGLPIHM